MSQAPNDLTFNIKAAPDAVSIQQALRETKETIDREMGGIHGQLEQANAIFGRSSTFGHLLHAAEGGGALFGLGMLGREAAEGTEKVKELVEKLHEGKITSGEMVDEILKGLPILGNFYTATRNITDLMSGQLEIKRELARIDKEQLETRKHEFEMIQKAHELHKQFTAETIAAQNAGANVYLEGPSRGIATLQQAIAERHRTKDDDLADLKQKAGLFDSKNRLDSLQIEIAQVQKKYDEANAAVAQQEAAIRGAYGASYNPNDPTQHPRTKADERADALKTELAVLNNTRAGLQIEYDDKSKKLADDFNSTMKAKDRAAGEEITKLRGDQQKEREALLIAGEKRIQDTLAHARAAGLTEERQQYEAHLVELKQSLSDSLDDLRRKTMDQVQKDLRDTTFSLFPTRAGQVGQDIFMGLREAAADFENFNAQSGASKKQFDEQERLKTLEREGQIAKANLDVLRAQAETGDRAAKLEIEKLEAAQKYRDLARELLSIMSNPAMTGDARAEASRQLGMLPFLQMSAIAGIRDTRALPADLAQGQIIRSAGEAAAAGAVGRAHEESQLSQYHDPQKEAARQMKDGLDNLAKIIERTLPKTIADAVKDAIQSLGFKTDDNGSNFFGF